jgi:hypothetical protein
MFVQIGPVRCCTFWAPIFLMRHQLYSHLNVYTPPVGGHSFPGFWNGGARLHGIDHGCLNVVLIIVRLMAEIRDQPTSKSAFCPSAG